MVELTVSFCCLLLILIRVAQGLAYYYRVCRDLWQLLGKQVVIWSIGAALAKLTWDLIASYVR